MGPGRSHYSTRDFPTKCVLEAEFASARYQKEDCIRSSDGLHEWWRDIEFGMVAVYEFDDIEYRTFDRTGRVVGDSHGKGDTGVEGVESFLRWEEKVVGCVDKTAVLL